MQTVNGVGEHRMEDYETKQDAVRLATDAAKRDALEHMASYLNSRTVVKDLQLVTDEIRSFTAGVLTLITKQVTTRFDGSTLVVHVEVTAHADPEDIARAIAAERQHAQLRPIPFSARAPKEFLFSPLFQRVGRFADESFTPQEIEDAASHHRGEKSSLTVVCDTTGQSCLHSTTGWFRLTQEDLDDIILLNALERRFVIDPESFFNSPACAKNMLGTTCIEELQDAGVPYQEILRLSRLRAEARRAALEARWQAGARKIHHLMDTLSARRHCHTDWFGSDCLKDREALRKSGADDAQIAAWRSEQWEDTPASPMHRGTAGVPLQPLR
jgi:hypothetical protein